MNAPNTGLAPIETGVCIPCGLFVVIFILGCKDAECTGHKSRPVCDNIIF